VVRLGVPFRLGFGRCRFKKCRLWAAEMAFPARTDTRVRRRFIDATPGEKKTLNAMIILSQATRNLQNQAFCVKGCYNRGKLAFVDADFMGY
jgi:hypothetical protein